MRCDEFEAEEDSVERCVLRFRQSRRFLVSVCQIFIPAAVGLFALGLVFWIFTIFGGIYCAIPVLVVYKDRVYWKKITIDNTNQSILVESNFIVDNKKHKVASTTFDGIRHVLIAGYTYPFYASKDKDIKIVTKEGAEILVGIGLPPEAVIAMKVILERRVRGVEMVERWDLITTHNTRRIQFSRCSKCGKELQVGSAFCNSCGEKQEERGL